MAIILRISGTNFEGIQDLAQISPSYHTQELRFSAGKLACLEINNDPEKKSIIEKMESLQNPPFTYVVTFEEGNRCCFVISISDDTDTEHDCFEYICSEAKRLAALKIFLPNQRTFYTGEEFIKRFPEDSKRILEVAGIGVSLLG